MNTQMSCTAWEPQLLQKGLCIPEKWITCVFWLIIVILIITWRRGIWKETRKKWGRKRMARGDTAGWGYWCHTRDIQVVAHPSLQPHQPSPLVLLGQAQLHRSCLSWERGVKGLPGLWKRGPMSNTSPCVKCSLPHKHNRNSKLENFFLQNKLSDCFFFLPSSIHSDDFLFYHVSKRQVSISNPLSLHFSFNSISSCHTSLH